MICFLTFFFLFGTLETLNAMQYNNPNKRYYVDMQDLHLPSVSFNNSKTPFERLHLHIKQPEQQITNPFKSTTLFTRLYPDRKFYMNSNVLQNRNMYKEVQKPKNYNINPLMANTNFANRSTQLQDFKKLESWILASTPLIKFNKTKKNKEYFSKPKQPITYLQTYKPTNNNKRLYDNRNMKFYQGKPLKKSFTYNNDQRLLQKLKMYMYSQPQFYYTPVTKLIRKDLTSKNLLPVYGSSPSNRKNSYGEDSSSSEDNLTSDSMTSESYDSESKKRIEDIDDLMKFLVASNEDIYMK